MVFFPPLKMARTNANKFPQVITKYGHTCGTKNFRYLKKNLVIYQVNLNDGLLKKLSHQVI
jgi:hypothetical protein